MSRLERTIYLLERIWKIQNDAKKKISTTLGLAIQRWGFLTFRVISFRLGGRKRKANKPVLCLEKMLEGRSAFWVSKRSEALQMVSLVPIQPPINSQNKNLVGQTLCSTQGVQRWITYCGFLPLNISEASGGTRHINRESQRRLTMERWVILMQDVITRNVTWHGFYGLWYWAVVVYNFCYQTESHITMTRETFFKGDCS